jgi:YegS/Rv2252/BmrU family lipid kinase
MQPEDAPATTTLAIINEHAGAGAMADIFRRIEHRLEDTLGPFDVAFTDGPGHATQLVRQALRDGYRRILSGGGDGTLNECVNGFFDEDGAPIASDACLGILSGGTGGDFRKTLGLTGTEDALSALARGRVLAVDVGLMTCGDERGGTLRKHFINIASFGLSGHTVRNAVSLKHWGGKVAYFGATLKSLFGWRNARVALTIDGILQPPRPVVMVAVGNGRYFGGGMKVCPGASLDSGLLEVVEIGDFRRFELMFMSRAMYTGTHIDDPRVRVHRVRVVEAVATSGDDVFIEFDGEPQGVLPARFEVLPGALKLIVP